jgi:hypothetical protein
VSCRTGCRTQDHATWGQCARDSGLQVGDLGQGVAARTDRRLNAYATARGLGLQPESTKLAESQRTLRAAGA